MRMTTRQRLDGLRSNVTRSLEYQGNVVTLSAQDSALLIENAALRTQEKQAFTSGRWTIRV